MEDVMNFSRDEITNMAKDCNPEGIKYVAAEIFSNKITTYRIAFFLAFAQKVIEENPHKKQEIYEDVFKSIYNGLNF